MLRLTVVLCAGLFVVLLIAGEDRGQVRQGLMAPPVVARAPAPVAGPTHDPAPDPVARVTEAVFVPVLPVRVPPESPVPAVEPPAPVAPAPAALVPRIEDSLAVVTARSANVRSGPSTADDVIDRLVSGEEVLVVVEESATEGWSLVRIEGDGIEGYVASRLLRPVSP